jgi:hypothetical protein
MLFSFLLAWSFRNSIFSILATAYFFPSLYFCTDFSILPQNVFDICQVCKYSILFSCLSSDCLGFLINENDQNTVNIVSMQVETQSNEGNK